MSKNAHAISKSVHPGHPSLFMKEKRAALRFKARRVDFSVPFPG